MDTHAVQNTSVSTLFEDTILQIDLVVSMNNMTTRFVCGDINHNTLADLGGVPGACPPTGPNSFVLAYIFAEKHLCQRFTPPLPGPPPPTGNPGLATVTHCYIPCKCRLHSSSNSGWRSCWKWSRSYCLLLKDNSETTIKCFHSLFWPPQIPHF